MAITTSALDRFANDKTVILTTYRRDGTPIDTPVHLAVDGDRAYIRTYATAFKTKRLRRNPEVQLWTASNGTRPAMVALLNPKAAKRTGFSIDARARLLDGEEARRAERALARKYPFLHGFLIPWLHRHLYRTQSVLVEITTPRTAARTMAA
jgi:PPOX class probable F420-dependent enzyme